MAKHKLQTKEVRNAAKEIEIVRSEHKSKSYSNRVGRKCGRGYVKPYKTSVSWVMYVDGFYAQTFNTRRDAMFTVTYRYPVAAEITFSKRTIDCR